MSRLVAILCGVTCVFMLATSAPAMIVTQTVTGADLATALGGGGGLTINSVSILNGDDVQFGTYSNFTSLPVVIGDGVVLSTGAAEDTTADSHDNGNTPSTNTRTSGTLEFDAYGPGHISTFGNSNDVAALMVNFSLSTSSQVGFDFIFGSVEYPVFVGTFTDAFLAFLDGTAPADQIVYDSMNQAVQVGTTFSSTLTTSDTNSAFYDPHGLVQLHTFTNVLAAGNHTIIFEVGDVNDHLLDSAAFIANLRATSGSVGTAGVETPEPGTIAMFGIGLACLLAGRRGKRLN